jgi:succinate dehydrogenase / fumarate reductase membrane anchor subunit
VILLLINQPASFESWHVFVSPIWFKLFTFVFFISLFIHAWLGVGDVFKDYVFNRKLRAVLQIIVDILLLIYLVWVSFILWNI